MVAAFDDDDRARLMADAGIVRNRRQIDATIGNAAGVLRPAREFCSFDAYLATMVPGPPTPLPPETPAGEIPATTPESDALSKDLRRRGFRFVGHDDRLRVHAERRASSTITCRAASDTPPA